MGSFARDCAFPAVPEPTTVPEVPLVSCRAKRKASNRKKSDKDYARHDLGGWLTPEFDEPERKGRIFRLLFHRSDMKRRPVCRQHRFMHRLRQGRMREDGVRQFLVGQLAGFG